MRSDDDKRELQARQRELTNQLNRTTPASGQIAGSGATTPPSRQREDSATSVPADEQQSPSIPQLLPASSRPSRYTVHDQRAFDVRRAGDDDARLVRRGQRHSGSEQVSDRAERVGCSGSRLARRAFPRQRASPIRSARERWRCCGSGLVRLGAVTAPIRSAELGERRSGRRHRFGFQRRTARRVLTAILDDACPASQTACAVPISALAIRQTVIRRRRRPPSAAPTLHRSRSRARHRVLRSKQAKRQCPRTRLPASVAAYLRLRRRPTRPTPGPLAEPTRARIGCTTTARPPR